MQHGGGGLGPVVEVGPQTLGNGEHKLADRDVGEDVVHQVGRRFGHALGVTGGAGASALAGKGHEEVVAATRAPGPSEPVGQDATAQVTSELYSVNMRLDQEAERAA